MLKLISKNVINYKLSNGFIIALIFFLIIGKNSFSQKKNSNSFIVSIEKQLNHTDFILNRLGSETFVFDSLKIAFINNENRFKEFITQASEEIDHKLLSNIKYSYKRALYLIDDKQEVDYWMDKYSVLIRGLRNRIKNDFHIQNEKLVAVNGNKSNIYSKKPAKDAKRLADETETKRLADEAEAKRLADEAESKRLADEAEDKRLADETEDKRLADEAETKRLTDETEDKRLADEAEDKRLTDETESKRLADEAEDKRLADEAETKRLADEAEAKRLADEAETKRLADEAETKRLADEAEAKRVENVSINNNKGNTLLNHKTNHDLNFFTIQIASVREIIPDRINVEKLDEKDLFYSDLKNKYYAMNFGKFQNYASAHKEAIKLNNKGIKGAYVTKYQNNTRVKVTNDDIQKEVIDPKLVEKNMNMIGYKVLSKNSSGNLIQIGSFVNWDAHEYDEIFKNIESTIYYELQNNNVVKFFIGPFNEADLLIKIQEVKKIIPDAFISRTY
ncbi:MAG: hypothetical protein P8L23_02355 [Flavobacteriales bacterium]|nr:hypothetical protein [Flavobacteriales bacterium]